MGLFETLQEKAKANPKRVAFPEATDAKILQAARQVKDLGIGFPTLVGEAKAINEAAKAANVSLDGIPVADNTDAANVEKVITEYAKINTTFPASSFKRMARDPMYFGLMLEALGEVDCLVCGIAHTTGDVILAAQTIVGMKEGISTPSSMGIHAIKGWEGPDGNLLAFADCAVNPAPDAGQLADIAITSAETSRTLLGWTPRVAMLSFSTRGSSVHERVDLVVQALNIVKEKRPDLLIDGEFQIDTALFPAVAARKIKGESPVAGKANVLIFPNLDAGNIGVKIFTEFANGGPGAGPLLQGFAKPVSDLSRGASVATIVGAATAVIVLTQGK